MQSSPLTLISPVLPNIPGLSGVLSYIFYHFSILTLSYNPCVLLKQVYTHTPPHTHTDTHTRVWWIVQLQFLGEDSELSELCLCGPRVASLWSCCFLSISSGTHLLPPSGCTSISQKMGVCPWRTVRCGWSWKFFLSTLIAYQRIGLWRFQLVC